MHARGSHRCGGSEASEVHVRCAGTRALSIGTRCGSCSSSCCCPRPIGSELFGRSSESPPTV